MACSLSQICTSCVWEASLCTVACQLRKRKILSLDRLLMFSSQLSILYLITWNCKILIANMIIHKKKKTLNLWISSAYCFQLHARIGGSPSTEQLFMQLASIFKGIKLLTPTSRQYIWTDLFDKIQSYVWSLLKGHNRGPKEQNQYNTSWFLIAKKNVDLFDKTLALKNILDQHVVVCAWKFKITCAISLNSGNEILSYYSACHLFSSMTC